MIVTTYQDKPLIFSRARRDGSFLQRCPTEYESLVMIIGDYPFKYCVRNNLHRTECIYIVLNSLLSFGKIRNLCSYEIILLKEECNRPVVVSTREQAIISTICNLVIFPCQSINKDATLIYLIR